MKGKLYISFDKKSRWTTPQVLMKWVKSLLTQTVCLMDFLLPACALGPPGDCKKWSETICSALTLELNWLLLTQNEKKISNWISAISWDFNCTGLAENTAYWILLDFWVFHSTLQQETKIDTNDIYFVYLFNLELRKQILRLQCIGSQSRLLIYTFRSVLCNSLKQLYVLIDSNICEPNAQCSNFAVNVRTGE